MYNVRAVVITSVPLLSFRAQYSRPKKWNVRCVTDVHGCAVYREPWRTLKAGGYYY